MRLIVRLFVFFVAAFMLLFVGVAFYVYAQTQSATQQTTNANMNGNINADVGRGALVQTNRADGGNYNGALGGELTAPDEMAEAEPDESADTGLPSVTWGERRPFWGYANTETITLRSGPEASATVVGTIAPTEYDGAEILDSTRDYLHVRFKANPDFEGSGVKDRDYEGWVEWGAVVPHMSALIVEAESGEVVGRLPLESGLASVAYSPDGKRAIFYGTAAQGFHGEASTAALEMDTESFKVVRMLETSATGGFAAFAFDPSGGDIYTIAQQINYRERGSDSRLYPFRISGEKIERVGNSLRPPTSGNFAVSPDGLTGIVIHNADGNTQNTRVDVLDLKTLELRNSFEIKDAGEWLNEFALSRDGAEFYYREEKGGNVVVINTRTGERVRELPLGRRDDVGVSFWQGSLVGDALLLRYWNSNESEDENAEAQSSSVWLRPDGEAIAAERGITTAIEMKGARYAVNEEGTLLFKLDGEGRIRERLKIARPEAKFNKTATQELTVIGLAASPDGKYLILFIGMVDNC